MKLTCSNCGTEFEGSRHQAKYLRGGGRVSCSKACRYALTASSILRAGKRAGHCVSPGCTSAIKSSGLCNLHYHAALRAKLPRSPCACGCGQPAIEQFISGHNTRLLPQEEQRRRAALQTGDALRDTGSGLSYRKWHSRHEHRVVMEQHVGRTLTSSDIVHHKNRNIRDNRLQNLELTTRSAHMKEHMPELLAGKRRVNSV